MKCEASRTPDNVDIPALREKYRQERDKRIATDFSEKDHTLGG